MPQCETCGKEIEETFLGKLNGTLVKEIKNNKTIYHYFCPVCQKKKAKEKQN